jgi:Flp pilus assembly protein TadG
VNNLQLRQNIKSDRGQITVWIVLALIILFMFVGFGIDLGLAYVTKTTLSKAVDSAALTAMKNVSQGTGGVPSCNITSAAGLAGDKAFNINYLSVPNLTTTPVPSICFSLDANNNTNVTVTASATLNTYFMRAFGSEFNTLTVDASATAQRNPLVMSLVLDVSYSMEKNGGSSALPGAVENFVADFDPNNDDDIDWVSVITFGTSAVTTVPNSQPFKDTIDTAMETNFWKSGVVNYTNSQSGLAAGQTQIQKIPSTPNLLRVLVFFTDGWPNIQQDTLNCAAHGTTKASSANLLYCGCDPGDESLGLCGSTNLVFFSPSSCSSDNACSTPSSGCGSGAGGVPNPTSFPDQQFSGASEPLSNVSYCGGTAPGAPGSLSSDAMYRTVLVSNDASTNSYTGQVGLLQQNTYVYSIGMGTAITGQPAAEEFLREVANDPSAATFNPNLPVGEAVFASDSSELNEVFQTIASKILLRLSK